MAGETTTNNQPMRAIRAETPPTMYGHPRVTRTSTHVNAVGITNANPRITAAVMPRVAITGPDPAGSSDAREATPMVKIDVRATVIRASTATNRASRADRVPLVTLADMSSF